MLLAVLTHFRKHIFLNVEHSIISMVSDKTAHFNKQEGFDFSLQGTHRAPLEPHLLDPAELLHTAMWT